MKVYTVNSFIKNQSGGNPAGVVLLDDAPISTQMMQSIAKKVGLSETAFVFPKVENYFPIRFFTPVEEVPLCGHATLAAFYTLNKFKNLTVDTVFQKTGAGLLAIKGELTSQGLKLVMEQSTPIQRNLHTTVLDELIPIMGLKPTPELYQKLPVQIWSTGLEDILLPVKDRQTLNHMDVDFEALSSLSKSLNVVGVHAFTIEKEQVYARNFAPLYGIDEESATGTSNGALIAYLHQHVYPNINFIEKEIIQGESMNATSAIIAQSFVDNQHQHIWVGGYCHFKSILHLS